MNAPITERAVKLERGQMALGLNCPQYLLALRQHSFVIAFVCPQIVPACLQLSNISTCIV